MTDCDHDWKTFAQVFAFGGLTEYQRCRKCKATRSHHPGEPWLDYGEDYVEGCE